MSSEQATQDARTRVSDRLLPHNLEAERSVLGAMFVEPESFAVAASILTPKDFFRAAHRTIYEVVGDLIADGKPPDLVLVKEELDRVGQLDEVGGPAYLAGLLDGVPRGVNMKHYAEIVVEKARLRNSIYAANRLLTSAYAAEDGAARIVETGVSELTACVANVGGGLVSLDDAIAHYINSVASGTASAPVPTGYADLDKLIRGLRRQNLVVVAARPSVGKSSLVMGIAENIAAAGGYVLAFPLEMSADELASRNLGWRSRVSTEKIEKGEATPEEYARVVAASETDGKPRIWIEERSRTVTEIGAWGRIAKQRFGDLTALIVDYMQLCVPERSSGNESSELASISHGLLRISKDLDTIVIGVSQLSRAPEARKDKRPQLADLRGSGAFEQDAHVVALLFREEMHKNEEDVAGVVEVIVAKNRNGPTGVVKLAFVKELALFGNLAF